MKTERSFPRFTVTKKAAASVKNGHPWIYGEEILSGTEGVGNGELCDAFSEKGTYLGTGLYSEKSKIKLRLLSDNANEKFDESFFARRLGYAIDHRLTVMRNDFECCRLVFGEADGLPGLTVDRYNDILVTQTVSFGMDMRKDMIFRQMISELLKRGVKVSGIFERNDLSLRELEGLPQGKGWYTSDLIGHPEFTLIEICENGIKYSVDIENGQKTGFFLDQKYNRSAASRLANGKKVLDCFTHTGSFAMNAVMGGAAHVTAVDISKDAIELAKHNARLNAMEDKMDFLCTDVFDLLPRLCEEHADYDYVILDPPAFTKSRKTVKDAERGYKEINFRAMKLLRRGGYLATCSCSHFMSNELFLKMLISASHDAGVTLKLVEARRQSPDHPILLNVPETDYLKFYLFQIV